MSTRNTVLLAALAALFVLSFGCKKEEAAPAEPEVAAEPAAEPAKEDHADHAMTFKYRCADAPDALLEKPGACEDGSLAVAVTEEGQEVEYFCPMHEQVVQAEPGRCPDCEMFLSARAPAAKEAAADEAAGDEAKADDHANHE